MRDGLYSYFSLRDKIPYGNNLRDKAFDFGPQFNKKDTVHCVRDEGRSHGSCGARGIRLLNL